jgi:Carboxypeptidase regulatory-like domain
MANLATLLWLIGVTVVQAPHLRLSGQVVPGRWVLITPFSSSQAQKLLSVANGANSLSLAGTRPGLALLCMGGEGAATLCERQMIQEGTAVVLGGPVAGVRVAGRLRMGRRPAAGARIALVPHPLMLRKPFSVPLYRDGQKLVSELRTDELGRFAAPLLAPGQYRLDIRLAGGRILQGEPFQVPERRMLIHKGDSPAAVPTFDLGELVVDDGLEVTVTVTDRAGHPIAGAGVGAMQEAETGRNVFFEALSDAAGATRLGPLLPGLAVALTCRARGFDRLEQHFATPPAAVSCGLSTLARIAGKIVDQDARPVSGATVSLRGGGHVTRSRSDGRFMLLDLTPGQHRLAVAAPGYKTAFREVAAAAGELRQVEPIELVAATRLNGTVLDGIRQEPVTGATVSVTDPPGFEPVVTGLDGSFALSAGGDAGLRLQVMAEGYPATRLSIAAEQLVSEEPLEIDLYPGGRVHVTAWDEDADTPCAGCGIVLAPAGGDFLRLVTDVNGEALSPLFAKGPCSATLETVETSGSMVQVRGGENVRNVTIEPDKTAEVAFGERLPALVVRFSEPLPANWSLRAEDLSGSLTVRPQQDGSFTVRRHPSEPVTLSLLGPSGLVVRQAVLPAAAAETALDLDLSQTQVGGMLLQGEAPAPLTAIKILAPDGTEAARAITSDTGSFLVPFLSPGSYSLATGGWVGSGFSLGAGAAVDLGQVRSTALPPQAAVPSH